MPKMKTHSSSKKRFWKNCNGKVKRSRAYKRHHAWAKTTKQNRDLRSTVFMHDSNEKKMKVLLPYGK
jgi:large subunit ribosomal protein L35